MIINGAVSDLVGLKFSLSSTSKRVSDPAYGKVLTDLIQDNKCDRANLSNTSGIRVSEETFGKIDLNKGGLDDQPKLESNMRELTIVPRTQRIMQDKDADGDGALSVDEMGISEEAFAKLDANEDGLLDQSELESGLPELGKILRSESDNEMSQTMGEMPPADKLQSPISAVMNSYLRVHSMTQNSENNPNIGALKDGIDFIA